MNELISINEPIPMNIKSMVMDYCFNSRRILVINGYEF